ncbi:adenylate kinase [Candidatus Aerophobetes bacterium]|uniref:Adenylate kinase n=1 Tax=Aerophobetes bacterium TaxID=2030807 RepID=A0A2A4YMU1_UNCAE|nr:MAG: adenylate kinase [Candidatus Aerophobetes bacterium]
MAKFISAAGSHCHLSSGDIFRGILPETPLGEIFHKYSSKGLLLPDELTINIFKLYLLGLVHTNVFQPTKQTLILDGLPRTLSQARLLDAHINVKGIILLEVEDLELLVNRIRRRSMIEKRPDDREQAILKKRLHLFKNETLKVLDHYDLRVIHAVNAQQRPLEVLRDILIKFASII